MVFDKICETQCKKCNTFYMRPTRIDPWKFWQGARGLCNLQCHVLQGMVFGMAICMRYCILRGIVIFGIGQGKFKAECYRSWFFHVSLTGVME